MSLDHLHGSALPNDEANESQSASPTPTTDWSFLFFFSRRSALENPIFCVLSFFFSFYSLIVGHVKDIFFPHPFSCLSLQIYHLQKVQ